MLANLRRRAMSGASLPVLHYALLDLDRRKDRFVAITRDKDGRESVRTVKIERKSR